MMHFDRFSKDNPRSPIVVRLAKSFRSSTAKMRSSFPGSAPMDTERAGRVIKFLSIPRVGKCRDNSEPR